MGYMGFRMQKWIYTMQPRRPFSIDRKSSFTSIPVYKREFHGKENRNKTSLFLGVVLMLVLIICTVSFYPVFKSYHKELRISILKLERIQSEKAFNFLMESGIYRLRNNNFKGAYSEFELALAIFPDNKQARSLYLETVSILCFNDKIHCEKLDY